LLREEWMGMVTQNYILKPVADARLSWRALAISCYGTAADVGLATPSPLRKKQLLREAEP